MQAGVTMENLADNMASFYRQERPSGKVALVLGAGNVASLGPGDILHKLFVEGQVCLFKHNPVNAYLGPFLEDAFRALIRDGFLRTAYGGPEVGEYLCRHPDIEEIHLTGSDRTYEAIVFGSDEEGKQRKLANQPRIEKRITCELGNVSPVIVVPGPWTRSDIQYHAANIATQMTNNCGFNCLAARVLILHKSWPQGRILLEELRSILAAAPQRKAYYPGAEQQYDRIISANATAEPVGSRAPGVIPYTLVTNLESGDIHNPLFTSECFMPVLAQTHLPGRDAAEFLRNAVEFCNTTLWGTLTACLLIHPETEKSLSQKFDAALDDLHYGTVAINHWGALGFTWGSPIWGAPPGHTPADIQSGLGIVHNTYLFDRPLKSIVHAPFRTWPTPPWFITHRQARPIFTRMVSLEARPNILSALRIAYSAMRG
jgi:acyl-CoA reductase-like NAD-dependent aldehyde dehydrogenase